MVLIQLFDVIDYCFKHILLASITVAVLLFNQRLKKKGAEKKNQLYLIAPECESHIKWAFVKITMEHDK